MPTSNQKKILHYNSLDLFNIVIDIEKYPDFIPWCTGARIIENRNKKIIADLSITYKLFHESFRSFVNYNNKNKTISINYTEGPLKSLNTNWTFTEMNKNKTLVNFEIDFEFKFSPLQLIVKKFYKIIEEKMMEAFENRANDILKK